MSAPIWVVDPAGNSNPYLKILSPPIFLFFADGNIDNNSNPIGGASISWSTDGINWTVANNPAIGMNGLMQNALGGITYLNGTWVCCFNYTYAVSQGNPVQAQVITYSRDGKNWTMFFQGGASLTALIPQIPFPNTTQNKWNFLNQSTAQIESIIPQSSGGVLKNDSLGGNAAVGPAAPLAGIGGRLKNPLPAGITAVRARDNNSAPWTFDYTATPITQDIINSGSDFPGATWVTTFSNNNNNSALSGGNSVMFGKGSS